MLDRWTIQWLRPPLTSCAKFLSRKGAGPDQVTICGFILGLCAIPALAMNCYIIALIFIILNRVADGIDGALARITQSTDAGGFLDIVLDFIFYSGVIFGFALADIESNALAAAALIFSFVGTGSSFLAYAIMAEKRRLVSITYPHKGFYYLGGLAEGTETVTFFVIICLWPVSFPTLAWCFAAICCLTTLTRIWGGYRTLRDDEST
ncbi:CDP-alcohol phosphatidyltransferase family protein [Desulfosediminicola flagellatus]|uniref:CDP-alcohol phosphatidyltransferase family protein n=1 Tax=Desulfosediminicola flagellatus TaxID=2569541 RepID=UPI0010AC8202|nr:CDP-alcohol phosphatidyltransferase family protein [Desulfosediminicola flagellatus]